MYAVKGTHSASFMNGHRRSKPWRLASDCVPIASSAPDAFQGSASCRKMSGSDVRRRSTLRTDRRVHDVGRTDHSYNAPTDRGLRLCIVDSVSIQKGGRCARLTGGRDDSRCDCYRFPSSTRLMDPTWQLCRAAPKQDQPNTLGCRSVQRHRPTEIWPSPHRELLA
jgi:hypothetical protein